jgi:hypothetical protein
LSSLGRSAFFLSALAVSNVDPSTINRVQLFNVEDEEYVGDKFTRLSSGYYAFDGRIDFALGESINIEKIEVHIYTEDVGTDRPALSGLLVCNRTSFISHLKADQEVVTPTGTAGNDGFVTAIMWYNSETQSHTLSVVVNHDLTQTVTGIQLVAPAASNTENTPVFTFTTILSKAAKALHIPINEAWVNWLSNHLGYVNILTTNNPAGAIRGQLIPTTSIRSRLVTFPNKATVNNGGFITTSLPDGGLVAGDLAQLRSEGARNLSDTSADDRVCTFFNNATSAAFDNDFRFSLPVTLNNKFSLRTAVLYARMAAEVNDTNKYSVGVVDLNDITPINFFTVLGEGRRNFKRYRISLDADMFPRFLGPGGVFISVSGSSLSGAGLFVDAFVMEYSVVNAYAANLMKSIFFKTSSAQ